MPFTVIAGRFRVVGQTQAGRPSGFEPDGDSVQFAPDDPGLLDRLPVLEQPVDLTSVGSTQLRIEGIDALEHVEAPDQADDLDNRPSTRSFTHPWPRHADTR